MRYLTTEEQKSWVCADLLPPPGGEVVRQHLTTISNLRELLNKAEEEMGAADLESSCERFPEIRERIRKALGAESLYV